MFFACPDAWSMTPATRALCVRRFRDRSARFFRPMDRQVAHNEEFFQFLPADFLGDIGIVMQNNPGLQRGANQFFLTRALDHLRDYAGQSPECRHLGTGLTMSI